ncbi:hypothetical protein GCK32_003435 [Trichostrongylus colubriformis]|uniref:Uncharacterized protein n=1 Tax=Trichostrongylus colubriformis TaxID=6319 RepID=A0AAN8IW50_TRICO
MTESADVECHANAAEVEEGADNVDVVDACSTKPSSSLDELFRDRYTMANPDFAKISEGFDPVVCIHPFHSKARRNYENNGGHRRGGWGQGQRGNWRGGRGGGQWRDDRRGRGEWRDDWRGQRRPWNDRGDREHGDYKRPRHE